jgi:hypothetical protein
MNTYPKLIALLVAIAALAPLEAKPKRPCAACQVRKPAAAAVRAVAKRVPAVAINNAKVGDVVGTIDGEVKQIAVIVPGNVKPGDVIVIGGQAIRVISCESGDGQTRITAYEYETTITRNTTDESVTKFE